MLFPPKRDAAAFVDDRPHQMIVALDVPGCGIAELPGNSAPSPQHFSNEFGWPEMVMRKHAPIQIVPKRRPEPRKLVAYKSSSSGQEFPNCRVAHLST